MLLSRTTTTTLHICTLSLHDALPISRSNSRVATLRVHRGSRATLRALRVPSPVSNQNAPSTQSAFWFETGEDRKSTRLNSSHRCISYAVFCLKKKNEDHQPRSHSHRN